MAGHKNPLVVLVVVVVISSRKIPGLRFFTYFLINE